MDNVGHSVSRWLLEWGNLEGWLAILKPSPVLEQFSLVNLSPSLHKAELPLGEVTAENLDRVDGKDRGHFVIVRMKVRAVMRGGRFGKHTNDDPEKPANLGHGLRLRRRHSGLMRPFYTGWRSRLVTARIFRISTEGGKA